MTIAVENLFIVIYFVCVVVMCHMAFNSLAVWQDDRRKVDRERYQNAIVGIFYILVCMKWDSKWNRPESDVAE